MIERLTLITGNPGKAAELQRMLGVTVEAKKIPLPEIQAIDVSLVAEIKAKAAFEELGRPVVVDDTGIEFLAWNGLPGALTSWFLDSVGNDGLLKMLEPFGDRAAKVMTALGYCDDAGVQVFLGELPGRIATQGAGTAGFGYDPIFIPEGQQKTFAEMSAEEKDAVSMRRRAADKLRDFIS